MNLLILLLFGILSTVYGIYKIPEHDACVLKVLLCDDFIKPLTPVDNSTLEMFKTIGELNAICEELSKFRTCLKNAEKFCEEHSDLDVGFYLLNNRRLAFDLCLRGSPHQHVYMMEEECVNKYSHSAIEFCTDKAAEKVGLEFYLGDYDSECRFLGEIQNCHIAVITDLCGGIAGNLLEKLVVFRGERDFMCIEYENDKLKNLETFYATMDSYVQQYKNIDQKVETEDETERIDRSKDVKPIHENPEQDRTSNKFQPRISQIPVQNCDIKIQGTSNHERSSNPQITKKPPSCSSILNGKYLDFGTPQENTQHFGHFYEQLNGNVISDEKYACKTKASFLLIEICPNGELNHIGFGEANILWSTYYPLKDLSCAWIANPPASTTLKKCVIMIEHSTLVKEICKLLLNCELPIENTLAVYETVNEGEVNRVAELRVQSLLKFSSAFEKSFNKMIHFYKKYAHDIRYWCSEQDADQDLIHSTSRKGFVPSEITMYDDMINGQSDINQKYNFYAPQPSEYPIDTEIHLLSSGDKDLESELEIKDNFSPQNYENLNSFLTDKIYENNLDELFSPHPSESSKSTSYMYRPYELFRPRVGETLETSDQDMSSQDERAKDASDSNVNLNGLPFEDFFENTCASHLYTKEICPALPENVSNLVNKLGKEDYINVADSLHIVDSNHYKKFQISEKRKDVPINYISRAEESVDINKSDQQNKFEEMYVVTTSVGIETASRPDKMVHKYSDAQNLNEDFQVSNIKDSQDEKGLRFEKESVVPFTDTRSSKTDYTDLISDYPNNKHSFSSKFAETSTTPEMASTEEFSVKSKTFYRRFGQNYSNEMEELLKTYEILSKMEIELNRIHKLLETQIKNRKRRVRNDEL